MKVRGTESGCPSSLPRRSLLAKPGPCPSKFALPLAEVRNGNGQKQAVTRQLAFNPSFARKKTLRSKFSKTRFIVPDTLFDISPECDTLPENAGEDMYFREKKTKRHRFCSWMKSNVQSINCRGWIILSFLFSEGH